MKAVFIVANVYEEERNVGIIITHIPTSYFDDLVSLSAPTSWTAQTVSIKKKDGSIRLCINYRKLNKATIPDRFPMPNVLDMVAGPNGVKYFITLDLVQGYYQMPLAEEGKPYASFSTARNYYQFKRLPFGLYNPPSAFQRGM